MEKNKYWAQAVLLKTLRSTRKQTLRGLSEVTGIEFTRLQRLEVGQYELTVGEAHALEHAYSAKIFQALRTSSIADLQYSRGILKQKKS